MAVADHDESYTAIVWGVGWSHEWINIAEAGAVDGAAEGSMCGTVMQGTDALPGSETPSRAKGSCRNLGDLASPTAASGDSGPRRPSLVRSQPVPFAGFLSAADPKNGMTWNTVAFCDRFPVNAYDPRGVA